MVGGPHGDALIVRVSECRIDGRATEAAGSGLRRWTDIRASRPQLAVRAALRELALRSLSMLT
jgi:hypothetical protein